MMNPTNTSSPTQRWQVYQVNSTAWTLRCQESGPNAWLGATGTANDTAAYLARGDVAGADVFWTIDPWRDSTWYMWNAANGSEYHLKKNSSNLLEMSSNITAPMPGQRWTFEKIEAIDDPQYSTLSVCSTSSATEAMYSLIYQDTWLCHRDFGHFFRINSSHTYSIFQCQR